MNIEDFKLYEEMLKDAYERIRELEDACERIRELEDAYERIRELEDAMDEPIVPIDDE